VIATILAILDDVDLHDVGGEGILHVTVAAGGTVQTPTQIVMTVKAHEGTPAEVVGTKTTWSKR